MRDGGEHNRIAERRCSVVSDNNIRVLVVEPSKEPYVNEVPNELRALQGVVGGHLESVKIDSRLVILCNEDGSSLGLSANCGVSVDRQGRAVSFVGTIFFAAHDGDGEFVSLSDEDVERCRSLLVPFKP